ncbi:hypothetical protein [Streptomyces brevispora]
MLTMRRMRRLLVSGLAAVLAVGGGASPALARPPLPDATTHTEIIPHQ